MNDSPVLAAFAKRLDEQSPATQADPHQSQPAGVLTMEVGFVLAINTGSSTAIILGTDLNNYTLLGKTCAVQIKGSIQRVPWLGATPSTGRVMVLVQPPMTYVLGNPSA